MNRATLISFAAMMAVARSGMAQTGDGTSDPQNVETAVTSPAQSPRTLLDEYVRTAVTQSPSLRAIRARNASAREQVAPAGALPDPTVGILYQSLGAPWQPMAPMSMVQGEISQMIPGVGKRQARREAAQADAEMRVAEAEVTRVRIAAEVRLLFAQIYATDKERHAVESAEQLIGVMLAAATGRFITGGVDQEALAKTEVERSRLKEQLLDLRANREILVAKLNRLLARSDDATVPNLDALPDVPVDLGKFDDQRLANSPELRVQRSIINASVRKRESAETETRPNFLVGLAGGATTSGEPIVTFRFGMELPLWRGSKQEPLVRAARHDTEAAESEYRALDLKLRGELAELRARFKRDSEQIALYRDEIIPKASLALHAARNAYATGRGDFSTVIEDYRIWIEAQMGLARRQADQLMTWTEYDAILSGNS